MREENAPHQDAQDEEDGVSRADVAGLQAVIAPDQQLMGKTVWSVRMRAVRLIQMPRTALIAIQAGAKLVTRGLLTIAQ